MDGARAYTVELASQKTRVECRHGGVPVQYSGQRAGAVGDEIITQAGIAVLNAA